MRYDKNTKTWVRGDETFTVPDVGEFAISYFPRKNGIVQTVRIVALTSDVHFKLPDGSKLLFKKDEYMYFSSTSTRMVGSPECGYLHRPREIGHTLSNRIRRLAISSHPRSHYESYGKKGHKYMFMLKQTMMKYYDKYNSKYDLDTILDD